MTTMNELLKYCKDETLESGVSKDSLKSKISGRR